MADYVNVRIKKEQWLKIKNTDVELFKYYWRSLSSCNSNTEKLEWIIKFYLENQDKYILWINECVQK